MKNPYGVEPTRYMKRQGSDNAIECSPSSGPLFGEISIYDHCNEEDICSINNASNRGYDCHPLYKSSLFVSTAGPDERNKFTVLDYEVYGIDYEIRENIHKLCKYPDIIWKYIKTNDISEESLKQVDDEQELLNDLDVIHCEDSAIRVKISQFYSKNSSELFSDTQLVNQQYDSYLREWIGDYKWKLLYRASEHEYRAKSFHEYCDDKGPSLVIIKSSGGWIFGGYTTESWSGDGISNEMIYNNQ